MITPENNLARMPPREIVPSCRYGHGGLERVEKIFSLPQVSGTVEVPGQHLPDIVYTGNHFMFSLWRCPVCGYLEMFDPD